jgi:hypothetical protein
MQKISMVKFHNDIAEFENAVDSNDCLKLIDLLENKEYPEFEILDNNRHDFSKEFKFTFNPDFKKLKKTLTNCLKTYIDVYSSLNQYTLISDHCKLQRTPVYGGFHSWHHEHNINDLSNRVLVWMLYLNTMEEGDGTTEFLYQNLEITPKQGNILIWPAYFTHLHRGNPPRRLSKYIATGWWNHTKDDFPYADYNNKLDYESNLQYFR